MADAAERLPTVAGTFYPDNPTVLQNMINNHLDAVGQLPDIDGRIVAIIVPHAGLVYSGKIAAHAYKLLEGQDIQTAVICGPSHRYRFSGVSVYGPDVTWKTPLGDVSCNRERCLNLLNYDGHIKEIPEAHLQEHCLEVQLPYLQTVLDDFKLVPVLMGYPDRKTIELLADALTAIEPDDKTIMIASTDWQHYRPASAGWVMDSLGIDCLMRYDAKRLTELLDDGKVEMCGGGATVAIMKAAKARGADRIRILKYGDSGDMSGDKSSVVGYVAAVIYASGENSAPKESKRIEKPDRPPLYELNEKEKNELLTIARTSISTYLETGHPAEFRAEGKLAEPGAAFVTLTKQEQLRGCIGHVAAVAPLYQTVATCAVQAAVADRRFPPVSAAELSQLHLEISVLTPMQKVDDINTIEVGRDGLMIERGNNRGLLLPQVATDYGWNRTQFLEQTCRKAGLPTDAYRSPDAVIYRFQALVFGE
ncbi:MAG: AmmeMemoRadiSam system protein B [candidate division Zixibacteria bacterium]|nr:AmmeMemoRadiSam system protein B [candidate division Zixibacteria bacterium]